MSEDSRLDAEKLVEIHKANDEVEGNLLVSFLAENGITASFQGAPSVNLEIVNLMQNADEAFGVYVLEEDAGKARELVKDFLAAPPDDAVQH